MINLFVQIIKIEKMNLSAQDMIDQLLLSFPSSSSNRCPRCGRGKVVYMTVYRRWLTEWRNGKIIESWIETHRYKCACGKSHVVLSSIIIPYRHHSLPLIIHALYDYYSHNLTVDGVCEKYMISVPTLYRWKAQFEKDKEIWLKGLKNIETSPISFLNSVMEDVVQFGVEFRQDVYPHRMFLQTHQNAFLHQYV